MASNKSDSGEYRAHAEGMRRGEEQGMNLDRTIYWIGGSACAGKSTLAGRLAEKYSLALYACDEHYGDHLRRITEEAQPAMSRVSRMTMNEAFFTRPMAEQLNTYIGFLREDFSYVLSDLAELGAGPVVVEGNQLMPSLVAPGAGAAASGDMGNPDRNVSAGAVQQAGMDSGNITGYRESGGFVQPLDAPGCPVC